MKSIDHKEVKMGSADFLLLGGIILGGFAIYLFVSSLISNNNDKQNLSWANNNEPVKSKNQIVNLSRPMVHQFTLQYALKFKNPT